MEINRRQLFRLRPRDFRTLSREFKGKNPPKEEVPRYFRPPGALAEEDDFVETCERCHLCADACPHDVIQSLPASAGRSEGTPFLDPANAPCRWCPDMPCIEACPSGALAFGENRFVAPIGKATLNLDTCLNLQGILCDTCAMMCPSEARAIRMVNRQPQLDADRCVGCGLCVHYCESVPVSLSVAPQKTVTAEL